MTKNIYKPEYNNSYALVIGINEYEHASPLGYAKNDAEVFANILVDNFCFKKESVKLLIDGDATRNKIHEAFWEFTGSKTNPNDRVLFFFAGHGFTQVGSRGDIGFLVPSNGNPGKLSTLIRWNELTANAELINAKHLFYVMDCCYSGLAITRSSNLGSMRFLKDMLQRYTRQVITAGKADETVADAGGPREGHSIFTGHLLEGLEGAAATSDGIITANSLMNYVYNKVAKDYKSNQSPHYGYIDGDGDFIFNPDEIDKITVDDEEQEGKDLLIEIPDSKKDAKEDSDKTIEKVKEYLSDSKFKIKLDDLVNDQLREVIQKTSEDKFSPNSDTVTIDTIIERMNQYEQIINELENTVILISKWGEKEHREILEKIFSRLAESDRKESGKVVLLGLRWYPSHYLMYSGGIAALSAKKYNNLATIFNAKVGSRITGSSSNLFIEATHVEITKLYRHNVFQNIPGYERKHVPKSEYLFKKLQPKLEDLLFLGRTYENLFDRFETFMALEYANKKHEKGGFWIPPGRFCYKYKRGRLSENVFRQISHEAETAQDNWKPLEADLFDSSYKRFAELKESGEDFIKGLNWY